MSKGILPIFSSRSFMVSGFAFRSLIHFESFCVYGVRKCSIISLLHAAVLFSQNHTLKRLSSLKCIHSCLLCHRLIDHFILFMGFSWQELIISVCIYLWLSILFHWSLHLFCVCVCWYHGVLITVTSLYSLKLGSMIPPTFFFFLKLALAVQGFLRFYNVCPPQKPLWVQATFAPHNRALPLASAALPLLWNCAAERAGPVWTLSLGWAECQGECKKPASVPGSFSLPSMPCSGSKQAHMQSSQVESRLPQPTC